MKNKSKQKNANSNNVKKMRDAKKNTKKQKTKNKQNIEKEAKKNKGKRRGFSGKEHKKIIENCEIDFETIDTDMLPKGFGWKMKCPYQVLCVCLFFFFCFFLFFFLKVFHK